MLANNTKRKKPGSLHNFYSMSHNFVDDSSALIQISKTTFWTYGPFIHTGLEMGHPPLAAPGIKQTARTAWAG